MFSLDDKRRRLATKRFNEHIKLLANVLNGASVVTIGAAVVAPVVGGSIGTAALFWIFGAVALHRSGRRPCGCSAMRRDMNEHWMIALTPFVFVALGVLGYFWMRRESRRLDREFGPDRPAGK